MAATSGKDIFALSLEAEEAVADSDALLAASSRRSISLPSRQCISRPWMFVGVFSMLALGTLTIWHFHLSPIGNLQEVAQANVEDKWTTWVRTKQGRGKEKSAVDSAAVAECAFESLIIVDLLARLGIQINQAAVDCVADKQSNPQYQLQCTADITGIISLVSMITSVISGIVSQCDVFASALDTKKQQCASGISGLVGRLTGVMVNAEHAKIWCPQTGKDWEMTGYYGHFNETRMSQGYGVIVSAQYDITKILCVLDISQLTFLLTVAGFNFAKAQTACSSAEKGIKAGESLASTLSDRQNCANDVLLGLAQTFSALGWIADAVSRCANIQYKEALCVGAITKAEANAIGVAQAITFINMACPAATGPPHIPRNLAERMSKQMLMNETTSPGARHHQDA